MIKKKDMENLFGMMGKGTNEIGKKGIKMEKESSIFLILKFGKKEYGKMEKELNGLNNH